MANRPSNAARGGAQSWQTLVTPEGVIYYHNAASGQTQWDKPAELKDDSDIEREGDWFWLPSPEEAFIPGRRDAINGDGSGTFTSDHGRKIQLKKDEVAKLEPLRWASVRNLEKDLVMLDVMNRPLILYHLKERFKLNQIYTWVGTILISINPYQRLPLYTPSVLESYIKRGPTHLPPHVYAIADAAYKAMREGQAQSVVISGESGAGKTECTKQALQYLAEIAGSQSNVEQRILQANPVLESFGNAKTIRNNNSSRFGKYVEIFFDLRSTICGARNTNYLLEKSRVVYQSPDERNYHVFYQLTSAATDAQRAKFRLKRPEDYNYLNQSGCIRIAGTNDVQDFEELNRALRDLEFKENEIDDLLRLVAAVLHIGNITFRSTGERECCVDAKDQLEDASHLLDVDLREFELAVTQRKIKVPGQTNAIDVPLSDEHARHARDALAKFIYEKQFDWLVEKINTQIGLGKAAGRNSSIGILDIFGFEIFGKNEFEQLCINFTNEKLQQFFNAHTFQMEETVYREEKINFVSVPYIDNQPVLDLIEQKPHGIFPLADEELIVPKGTDQTFVQKVLLNHKNTKEFASLRDSADLFLIKHYAGDVTYQSVGFLDKNKDTLNQEAYDLLARSKFKHLAQLFPAQIVDAKRGTTTTNKMKQTLAAKFCKQLADLMDTLNSTEPHYIRCIKPNGNKAPLQFDAPSVLEQLQYSGVFEAVQIRKSGFPFRYTHKGFAHRFKCVMKEKKDWSKNDIENCKTLIAFMKQNLTDVQIGTKRVLYRAQQHRAMELVRNVAVQKLIVFVQAVARGYMARNLFRRMRAIVPVLEAAIRSRDIDQLEKALIKAATVGYPMFLIKKAERMRHVFLEERRLENIFKVLLAQDPYEFYQQYKEAVDSANDIELNSPLFDQIKARYGEATQARLAVEEEGRAAIKEMLDKKMKAVLDKAAAIYFTCETTKEIECLLYDTSENAFQKMQLKAAVQFKDTQRVIKTTIRLKDLFFKASAPGTFSFNKYPKLYAPDYWASKKFLGSKEEIAAGMLKWSKSPIHYALTKLPNSQLRSLAPKMFKNIMCYMGDRNYQQPAFLAQETLKQCLTFEALRGEIYCQIVKQVTDNPHRDSAVRGWEMMAFCLNTFPPPAELENYLEMFLRSSAFNPEQYVNYLHEGIYAGERREVPTLEEMDSLAHGHVTPRLGYSIAVPDMDTRPTRPINRPLPDVPPYAFPPTTPIKNAQILNQNPQV